MAPRSTTTTDSARQHNDDLRIERFARDRGRHSQKASRTRAALKAGCQAKRPDKYYC